MPLASLDWTQVRQHYDERKLVHDRLLQLHQGRQLAPFVELALGISDANGNYSASEHGIGPKVLHSNANAPKRVFDLASKFLAVTNGTAVPPLIKGAALSYLQVGVGSELSCMMNPGVCWVANTRTIWAHLLIKHNDNYARADEELSLYRENDTSSEMVYKIWIAIHGVLDTAMTRLAALGNQQAMANKVQPGSLKYLWADAVANELYAEHFG